MNEVEMNLVVTTIKIHEYAERLTATLPESLNCVYFVNSGSEANDMAMMMAREYTGNFDIISFRNSYHGNKILFPLVSVFLTMLQIVVFTYHSRLRQFLIKFQVP